MDLIKEEIKRMLENLPDGSDFSDLGNMIGIIIEKSKSDELGFDTKDFESGFDHGVSISNGTH